MKEITRIFLTGLAVIFPVAVTIYLLIWIAILIERALDGVLRFVLPQAIYLPGLGVALGLLLVFAVGLAMRTWIARNALAQTEKLMYRLPLVKSIYGMLRDFSNFLTRPRQQGLQQVVTVTIAGTDLRFMGFITRKDFTGLPPELGDADTVAVYLPMSYQIGGYTALVPRACVQPVEMSLEEGMRFILTAGLSIPASAKNNPATGR